MSIDIKTVERQGGTPRERVYLIEVFKGMAVTFGHFIRNLLDNSRLYIRHYPEVEPEITPRWRGRHRLTRHEDGTIKCVACFMCQTNCPARCIMIEAGERSDGRTEKLPLRFDIDLLECIYCGYCVEACPMDAIRMDTGIYALTGTDRQSFVIGLDQLMLSGSPFTDDEYRKGSE